MLDQAAPSEPTRPSTNARSYILTTNTTPQYRVEILLVRELYWEAVLAPEKDDGKPEETSRIVRNLAPYARMVTAGGKTQVRTNLPGFDLPGIGLDEVLRAGIGTQCKVAGIRQAK